MREMSLKTSLTMDSLTKTFKMNGCRPHYFQDAFGENVECSRCGFIRHKTNIDTQIDFTKVTGLLPKQWGYTTDSKTNDTDIRFTDLTVN